MPFCLQSLAWRRLRGPRGARGARAGVGRSDKHLKRAIADHCPCTGVVILLRFPYTTAMGITSLHIELRYDAVSVIFLLLFYSMISSIQ